MNVSKCGKTLAAAWAAVMVMAAATAAEYKPDGPDGTITQAVDVNTYVIDRAVVGVNTYITVKNGSQVTQGTLQQVLDYIRSQSGGCTGNCPAVPVAPVSIQFGDGTNVLDIGSASAGFYNSEAGVGGGTWSPITLSGKITSSIRPSMVGVHYGTVSIGSGVFVTSAADITNTSGTDQMGGVAISVHGGGTVIITGGTITSTNSQLCRTIDKPADEQSGFGSVILGGSPTINGTVHVGAGKLSVITTVANAFNPPAGKQYTIAVSGGDQAPVAGDVAVVGGANFAANFTLTNIGFGLTPSGNDLVLLSGTYNVHVVVFDSRNGSYVAPQNIPNGGKVTKPADPTREGYTFNGWYVAVGSPIVPAERSWNFDEDVVTSNITLNANWTITTSITHRQSAAAKQLGIAVSGAGLRIVGTSQATPIRIYDMRGKLMMTRSAMPNEHISVGHLARGTYVVKAVGVNVKFVR